MLSCLLNSLSHVGDFQKVKKRKVISSVNGSAELAVYQLATCTLWFGAASVLRFGPQ